MPSSSFFAMKNDGTTNTATFTFDSELADANYRATLLSAGVTDPPGNPLDGNADDLIGGDHAFDFFVLAGDTNRDRLVDISDLGVLATNWQQSPRDFSQGDFNYDQTVDITDLGMLATNWQSSLPAPFAREAAGGSREIQSGDDATDLIDLIS